MFDSLSSAAPGHSSHGAFYCPGVVTRLPHSTGGQMPTERNIQAVAELEEDFKTSPLVIAANYRGLSVSQMHGMRRAVRESNSVFKITKNTLARIAADNAGRPELKEIIDGPIGFLTTEGDPAAAAKVLVNYIDDNSIEMTIVGGALEREMLTADRVKVLARLPSREVLLSKMLGSMNSPITGLVTVMSGPVRALATVLQRISELGGASTAVETETEQPAAETPAEAEEAPVAQAEETPAAESDETTQAGPGSSDVPEEPAAEEAGETTEIEAKTE